MSGQCDDAESCKQTGECLCNCKGRKHHPGTCCTKSCPLAFIHCLGCWAIASSDHPYELAKLEHRMDPDWDGSDPCHCDGEPNCCGFVYHTVVCSVCLPFMVLALIGGTVCWCVGCWNGCCGCDERCKGSAVQPIQVQPVGGGNYNGGQRVPGGQGVWATEQSGQWD